MPVPLVQVHDTWPGQAIGEGIISTCAGKIAGPWTAAGGIAILDRTMRDPDQGGAMSPEEFEHLVDLAAERLPQRFKAILRKEEIRLLAREKPPPAARGRSGDLVFGMFIGTPYTERSVFGSQAEPTRIELYQDSFEKACADREEMERQILLTVVHEIGHYFGFSEKELREHLGE